MKFRPRHPGKIAALSLALALAACSGGPKVPTGAPPAVPTAQAEIEAIEQLLDQGDERAARKRIDAALKRDAMNPSLMVLQQAIEGDAREQLGPTSYPYVVQSGDTMAGLAQRFLGNRLKAYQLAKYNGIEKPAALAAGQSLRIPGQPPRAEPPRRAEPRPAPSRAAPPRATPTPTPAPARAAPAPRAANPAAAQQARTAGLAALNNGAVANAVTLLRRAAALDPGNAAIARDLARAERIAATVRARR